MRRQAGQHLRVEHRREGSDAQASTGSCTPVSIASRSLVSSSVAEAVVKITILSSASPSVRTSQSTAMEHLLEVVSVRRGPAAGRDVHVDVGVPPSALCVGHQGGVGVATSSRARSRQPSAARRPVLRAGGTVNIPANAPHQFTNASQQPARLLCVCTPTGSGGVLRRCRRPRPRPDDATTSGHLPAAGPADGQGARTGAPVPHRTPGP